MGLPAKLRWEVEKERREVQERAAALLERLAENTVVGMEEKEAPEKALPIPAPSPSWLCTPLHDELERTYATTTISVISSASIQKKATRALEVLALHETSKDTRMGGQEGEKRDTLVVLHTKAKVASKLITIAEIVKREVGEKGGKWFQYNAVGSFVETLPAKPVPDTKAKSTSNDKHKTGTNGTEEAEADEEGEEESFETMKTPFERAIEGTPKVNAVPTMTIYLSRVRIETLRKEYGEQTNGLEKVA